MMTNLLKTHINSYTYRITQERILNRNIYQIAKAHSRLGREKINCRYRQFLTKNPNKAVSMIPNAQKIWKPQQGIVRYCAGNISVIITYVLNAIPCKINNELSYIF